MSASVYPFCARIGIILRISAIVSKSFGNGLQAESTIEVGADPYLPRIACHLADVIHLCHEVIQGRRCLALLSHSNPVAGNYWLAQCQSPRLVPAIPESPGRSGAGYCSFLLVKPVALACDAMIAPG